MVIPTQLVGLRFNRVIFKDKRAFEKDWQTNHYTYDEIQKYFPNDNYGVICGSDIRVLDDDTPKKGLVELFIKTFGETFRVRDHLYFKFDNGAGKKIIFKHNDIKFEDGKGGFTNHMGELQGDGTYVVGAGSIHPSGETYNVVNDVPIKIISYDKFMKVFGEYVVGNNDNKISSINKVTYNADDDALIKEIKEKWMDGDRQNLTMDLAGYLRKERRLGLNSALSIIKNICDDCGDTDFNEREKAIVATYNKDERDVKGVTGLKERDIGKPGMIFGVEGQVNYFINRVPVFYDKSNIWWLWNDMEKRWVMSDETDILNEIRKDGVDTISSKTRVEIIAALKQLGRKNKPAEVIGNWIQFKDKIVDLDNGEIFDSTPKYFVTNPVPWELGDSEDTPTLDKYFAEWVVEDGLQDKTYVNTLYEIMAYSCMSKQFLQRMFAFVGSGSNGKGVFFSILKKFIGKDNCCSTELKLLAGNNFETSTLYKKQVCFMGEVDAYDMTNTNIIKKLSGEDDIRYCFKGKTAFTDESSTTCLMNTNSMPVSPDKSKGFYRRWMIVDFPHEFPVGRDILAEISDKEFSNLARKCVRICKELLKNKKFTNEGDLDVRIKRYEDRSNPMMTFISDHCVEDIQQNIPVQTFLKELNEYLKDNRLRIKSMKDIQKAIKDEGFEINRRVVDLGGHTSKMNCIIGIGSKWESKDDLRTQRTHLDALLPTNNPMSNQCSKPRPFASFASSDSKIELNQEKLE